MAVPAMVVALLLLAVTSLLLKSILIPYDCSKFDAKPGQFQAGTINERRDFTTGLQFCPTLTGATEDEVRAFLGPPDAQGMPPFHTTDWSYAIDKGEGRTVREYLRISFKNGRVERASHFSTSYTINP